MSCYFGGATVSKDELFGRAANFRLAVDFRTDWEPSPSAGGGEGNLSRRSRAYRLADARCRVAQTVHRTVCYCSLFDSHQYNKKREAVPKGTTPLLERVMGIEPTRPAWKAGILAIELHPHIRNR